LIGLVILIIYIVIVPRILEKYQIIASDWREKYRGGDGCSGGGG
jgi:hypothetical protein